MTGPRLVGIDLGTSHIRAVLIGGDGAPLGFASEPTPVFSPHPGEAEHDAEALWQSVRRVLRRLDGLAGARGVAVASFGESLVAINAGGAPLAPVLAWHDERPGEMAAWLEARFGAAALFAASGLRLDHTLGLCKLLWMRRHWPEAMGRTVRVLGVADWIAFRLSGVAATDCSLASRSLALDLPGLRWNTALIEACGIDPALMPPLRRSGAALGPVTSEAAAATGLPAGAMVGVGGHDHVVGALAAGIADPGIVLNSLGTAEVLLRRLPRPVLTEAALASGCWQGAARVAPGLDLFYGLGALPCSGGAVEWFRAACADGASHRALIDEAAAIQPGSLGVRFLPPDPARRGAFLGLTASASRGALYRAVLEGLAFESRAMLEAMDRLPGLAPPRAIHAIGGGCRNELFLSIKAAVLNRPLRCMPEVEGSALGAALLAGIAAGLHPDLGAALAASGHDARLIRPEPALAARYEALYRRRYLDAPAMPEGPGAAGREGAGQPLAEAMN